MKIFSIISIALLLSISSNAQIAESVDEAKTQGITMKHLDSLYMDAINVADSNKAAFKGHMNEFSGTYKQMLHDVWHYLERNDSLKNKSFHWWQRIYFQANGTIDYYLYSLKPDVLTKDEEAIFKKSLNEFIKTYKFPMNAKTPFVQCSSVNGKAPK